MRLARVPLVLLLAADLVSTVPVVASGEAVWVVRYDGPAHWRDKAQAVAVSPDSARVYVTGPARCGKGHCRFFGDCATIAYDAVTGAGLWVARYDGPASRWDQGNALAVGPDGAVYVVGQSVSRHGYEDYVTIRYGTS